MRGRQHRLRQRRRAWAREAESAVVIADLLVGAWCSGAPHRAMSAHRVDGCWPGNGGGQLMSNSLPSGSFIATASWSIPFSSKILIIVAPSSVSRLAPASTRSLRIGDRNGPTAAGADVQVKPVLDRLALGYHLEPNARTGATGIGDTVRADPQVFLGHSGIAPVIIPGGEASRRRLQPIPQRGGPKAGKPLPSAQSITSWKLTATCSLLGALEYLARRMPRSVRPASCPKSSWLPRIAAAPRAVI